ncbi:TetR/AcrR family transcriptional regulator [Trinickia symbiotica]|uniref:TetR/AcrR family transcriptional regulator n=1 Tax=Trinickia symbiotica TaxID=863227 RepID=A0A2N7X9D0_9BURK|nr:TetR/AcrR family transcriptional regulator [Trinickia symbiotica]
MVSYISSGPIVKVAHSKPSSRRDGEKEMGTVAVRNLKKRQAILEAAYQLFRTNGFERTSMSAIVAVVGGSKGTIYAHFGSKEKLFVDCMFSVPEYSMARMLEGLRAESNDLDAQLREFGESFLRLACTSEVVSVRRLMISEAQRGGVGRMFYERFQTFQQELASFVSRWMAHGRLHRADAHIAATQLRLLLEAEVIDPLLLCATDGPIADVDVRRMSSRAIDTFLRAYAPKAVQTTEPAPQGAPAQFAPGG